MRYVTAAATTRIHKKNESYYCMRTHLRELEQRELEYDGVEGEMVARVFSSLSYKFGSVPLLWIQGTKVRIQIIIYEPDTFM